MKLAIDGGKPIRSEGWPKWPQYNKDTIQLLKDVLTSQRWAISGPYVGTELFEKKFAKAFAEFCNAKFCIPCDHGSSALLIALESLGIGYGDEVIIPAITWVATATSVVNVNAIPVLVDIDPITLCIDPKKIEEAISPNTKAIMPVHLYSGMADMDSLIAISKKYNIPILEDSAHAHGAKWNNEYAGTIGKVGAFSMQQGKGLTCGEGGAVLTNDENMYNRLQELRADSRIYVHNGLKLYDWELATNGNIQGTNFCLSEFQSAILLSQMKNLQEIIEHKIEKANILDSLLENIEGVYPLAIYKQVTQRAYYCYTVRLDLSKFGNKSNIEICEMLKAELNIPFFSPYEPINSVLSYNPTSKKRNMISEKHIEKLNLKKFKTPEAEKAFKECICMPHWVLLGQEKDMNDIKKAYSKIQEYVS
jgi:dTDP-4-amino-4,6-dideoxygalactose transaminase